MTDFDWTVRAAIYGHLIEHGTAPTAADLAQRAEASAEEVEASLDRLHQAHLIALHPGTHELWMAHPFATRETAYPARVGERTYFGNCVWDALGIPAILDRDSWTVTRCPWSGEKIEFGVQGRELIPDDGIVHFLVPARSFWDDIGFT